VLRRTFVLTHSLLVDPHRDVRTKNRVDGVDGAVIGAVIELFDVA